MKGGFEQPEIASTEQQENQEKLDGFLEEIRPTVESFIFSDLDESNYRYEIGQMIEKFRKDTPDIPVKEITRRIEKIEKNIEEMKLKQLELEDKNAA